MSDSIELKAQTRERIGKGASRELRRNSMVPAVIYGNNQDPLPIALPYKELAQLINSGGFQNTILDLDVDGAKHRVLPKDYQREPVRDFFTHVDFLRVGKNTKVTVEIPVQYINEEASPGIKTGGVLNVVRYTLEVKCRADAIPEVFEIDLTGLEVDDVVHASKIALPDGVELTVEDRDPTMCSIAAPTVSAVEEEETEAPESVEVPSDQKSDGEEGGEE